MSFYIEREILHLYFYLYLKRERHKRETNMKATEYV